MKNGTNVFPQTKVPILDRLICNAPLRAVERKWSRLLNGVKSKLDKSCLMKKTTKSSLETTPLTMVGSVICFENKLIKRFNDVSNQIKND